MQKQLDSNFRIMEQIRARVDAIVEDPETAEALKPYYPYGCKRPTFHDEYLPTFNLPHVHLVDTAPIGVTEINERGVVHDGVEYPLDVLIYATGFQWMATSTFNMVVGRSGRTLSEKWQTEGTKTFLGLHSRGFPNLFIVTGPQGGGGSFNFTDAIDSHGDYVVWMLSDDARPGRASRRRRPGAGGAPTPSTAAWPTSPPRRCATASRTTTATATPRPAASPTTAAATGTSGASQAQETMEPYVFGPVDESVDA